MQKRQSELDTKGLSSVSANEMLIIVASGKLQLFFDAVCGFKFAVVCVLAVTLTGILVGGTRGVCIECTYTKLM